MSTYYTWIFSFLIISSLFLYNSSFSLFYSSKALAISSLLAFYWSNYFIINWILASKAAAFCYYSLAYPFALSLSAYNTARFCLYSYKAFYNSSLVWSFAAINIFKAAISSSSSLCFFSSSGFNNFLSPFPFSTYKFAFSF